MKTNSFGKNYFIDNGVARAHTHNHTHTQKHTHTHTHTHTYIYIYIYIYIYTRRACCLIKQVHASGNKEQKMYHKQKSQIHVVILHWMLLGNVLPKIYEMIRLLGYLLSRADLKSIILKGSLYQILFIILSITSTPIPIDCTMVARLSLFF